MKYFIDFEFIEGFKKPLFGKRRHFIDLISVGVKAEDESAYYAISTDFNPKDADEWVRKNVIGKLEDRYFDRRAGDQGQTVKVKNPVWKSQKQIVGDLLEFFGCYRDCLMWRAPEGIEIYGYYADYDWVLMCSLFGRMIDLPKGMPMYCRDLKQELDMKADEFGLYKYDNSTMTLDALKKYNAFPKQDNEHNALSDAKWNFELYKFLQTI